MTKTLLPGYGVSPYAEAFRRAASKRLSEIGYKGS